MSLRLASSYRLTEKLNKKLQISCSSDDRTDAVTLREIVSQDFCAGDVQIVDGWRLSTTEVLLAVLAYRAFGAENLA